MTPMSVKSPNPFWRLLRIVASRFGFDKSEKLLSRLVSTRADLRWFKKNETERQVLDASREVLKIASCSTEYLVTL